MALFTVPQEDGEITIRTETMHKTYDVVNHVVDIDINDIPHLIAAVPTAVVATDAHADASAPAVPTVPAAPATTEPSPAGNSSSAFSIGNQNPVNISTNTVPVDIAEQGSVVQQPEEGV